MRRILAVNAALLVLATTVPATFFRRRSQAEDLHQSS